MAREVLGPRDVSPEPGAHEPQLRPSLAGGGRRALRVLDACVCLRVPFFVLFCYFGLGERFKGTPTGNPLVFWGLSTLIHALLWRAHLQ